MQKVLNNVFVKQFGAIKPPWIHIDTFYKLPFNFCNRWCERCKLSRICRVYQTEIKRNKEFVKKGINPRSTKAVLLSITKDFEEIKKYLTETVKKLNITQKDLEKTGKLEENIDKQAEKDPLYKIALKLSLKVHEFIEDLYLFYLDIPKYLEENILILKFYFYFFSAKIFRAISSEIEEKDEKECRTYDEKTSAFLAYISIIKLTNALKNYSYVKDSSEVLQQKSKQLILLFDDLKIDLEKRFGLNIYH